MNELRTCAKIMSSLPLINKGRKSERERDDYVILTRKGKIYIKDKEIKIEHLNQQWDYVIVFGNQMHLIKSVKTYKIIKQNKSQVSKTCSAMCSIVLQG